MSPTTPDPIASTRFAHTRSVRLAVLFVAICCTLAAFGSATSSAATVEVKLAKRQLAVGPAGNMTVRLSCSSAAQACFGTVTLKARRTGRALKKKTLVSTTFILVEGRTKALNLHITRKALKLLKRRRVLHAGATILARDPTGATHTTLVSVTLRPS